MKKTILVLCLGISIILMCGCESNTNNSGVNNEQNKEGEVMEEFSGKINITINNKTFSATLEDNETSRAFVKKLPLNITMQDLNGNEKYYYLDGSLPSNSTRVSKINSGDIMLYGDNCLVLFYDTFNTSYSYTRIGKLDNPSDIKNIVGKENIEVYISN